MLTTAIAKKVSLYKVCIFPTYLIVPTPLKFRKKKIITERERSREQRERERERERNRKKMCLREIEKEREI